MQRLSRFAAAIPLSLFLIGLMGCSSTHLKDSSTGEDMVGQIAYTQHVLRPDRIRGRLYTLNYLQSDAIMPLCTKVKVSEINRKVVVFTELDSGREFQYLYHKATGVPIETAAAETFALSCNAAEAKRLSSKDQQGISKGEILVGMSKKGVLLAAGRPPAHRTPSTDGNQWTYWKNRFNTMVVYFNDKGLVERIVD